MLRSMQVFRHIIKTLPLFLLLGAGTAHAEVMKMKIARIKAGIGTLQDVQVDLNWPRDARQGELRIRAATLDFPLISYREKNIDWQCPLVRTEDAGWHCLGNVRGNASPAYPLALDYSVAGTTVDLRINDKKIRYENSVAAPDLSRIELEKIPVAWLKAYLAGLWREGNWTSGNIGGRIDVLTPSKAPFQVTTDLQLNDVGLETSDGWLAAAAMKGRLRLDYREVGKQTTIQTRYTANGGEFLAQGLYVLFPKTPVEIEVKMQKQGAGLWLIPAITWQDPGILDLKGNAGLNAKGELADLNLDLNLPDLATARDRYLSGFLAPAGFPDLILSGGTRASLNLRDKQLELLETKFSGVNAIDSKARFTFAGINGDVRWTQQAGSIQSAFTWDSAAMYGIGLGKAKFAFDSANGSLKLSQPVNIQALEGIIRVDHFRWQPPKAELSTRFELGMSMDKLDMASLSQRLGWPAFTGSISGKIPNARYQDNMLNLDGGLQMSVFSGEVGLSNLVMERPFGVAPTLSADVALNNIDMEPMTRAFEFGSITGSLDGYIRNLRLVDWSPVAFDARFYTDDKWKGKRRISQKAVRDISSVGGSGLMAGLQNQVLKVFDDFGYEKIGISCKLKDNICTMDGIGSAGDGYIIVAGGGLPRIQVVGFRRRVDWPTLVSRLEAATEGQAPVIQ
ncbi:MAG: hypothetical protein ACREPB_07605 [Arenimonas sp.]